MSLPGIGPFCDILTRHRCEPLNKVAVSRVNERNMGVGQRDPGNKKERSQESVVFGWKKKREKDYIKIIF